MCTARSIVAVSAILLGATFVATSASAQPPGRRGEFGCKGRAMAKGVYQDRMSSTASQEASAGRPRGLGEGRRGRHGVQL